MRSAFLIAAPHSGAGKTTVTLSLLSALKARGLKVQGFKSGPDYIDPLHHQSITGLPSHNLDTWMLPPEVNRNIFTNHASRADVSVVEGAMGLFDGVDGVRAEGSASSLALLLDLPVVLVVDARSMARSAAALVYGFVKFNPDQRFAGIIWNRVGSPAHRRILDEAVAQRGLPPVLGAFPRDETLSMGERHLGLVTPKEGGAETGWTEKLALAAETHIDIDKLLGSTRLECEHFEKPALWAEGGPVIAVARDRAYSFYYQENLSLLERLGARLVFFKPSEGDDVPETSDALYLGGGYPELYAEEISSNSAFMASIRRFHAEGKPIYGECGGFMTLCARLRDGSGKTHEMAGIFPSEAIMGKRLARLGYREVTGLPHSPLSGLSARGHEFHYSAIGEMPAEVARVYSSKNSRGEEAGAEGYASGSAIGSYVHLHFCSNPEIAEKIFRLKNTTRF